MHPLRCGSTRAVGADATSMYDRNAATVKKIEPMK